jgi:HPt (histidine-containing phosphotransfer) domain-containing protein
MTTDLKNTGADLGGKPAAGRAASAQSSTPDGLAHLLDALEGDQEAMVDLIDSFLACYPAHLQRIAAAVGAENPQLVEKTAHHFKGCLGIFCHTEPLQLTQQLIDMGERETLSQAPQVLQLLQQEMEPLLLSLRRFAGR